MHILGTPTACRASENEIWGSRESKSRKALIKGKTVEIYFTQM